LELNINNIYVQKINEIQSRVPVKILNDSSNKGSFADILAEQTDKVSSENIKSFAFKADTGSNIKTPDLYANAIKNASQKYDVNDAIISAVIKAESGFNPSAVSSAGAMGLMQLMPATASGLGVDNPYNPEENIDGGVRYLKQMIGRYGGDVKMALAAYNCGSGTLNRLNITDLDNPTQFSKLPAETRNYVSKIMGYVNSGI